MSVLQKPLVALWLLLATWPLPAQLSCTKGQSAKCKDAPAAPGTNLAGEGFDVVTMERKQAYVIDVDTWKQEDGSCTLCVNPFMDESTQRLPAAVVDWRPTHQCHMKLSSTVYESSEAFVRDSQTEVESSWKVGLDLATPHVKGSVTVGGTNSQSAKTAMAQSKQDKFSFIMQEVHCSYYSYRLKEDPPLHPEFIRSIQRLPALYTEQTKADYTHLLITFGTHFIRKVHLGGKVKSVTSLRVCQMALDGYTETVVRDCLEAEASLGTSTGTVETRAEGKYCKGDLKKRDSKDSFSHTFRERLTQVVGGQTDGTPDLLFSAKTNPTAFSDWAKSLKSTPDIIGYGLHPLYLLVKHPKKRQGVKRAIEDYILEHALIQRCSDKCSKGSTSSSRDACKCVCQSSETVTGNCCPQERGLAHLTITVKRATGLWGDKWSKTDSFVKALMGTQAVQTRVIYNNDNPRWNENFYLGTVKLSLSSELKLEVWDEDKEWYKSWNDLLGSCIRPLEAGTHDELCPLNHGTLFFTYKAECAPGLGGRTCGEYIPSGMRSDLHDLYTSRNSLNVTSDLLAELRMGHNVDDPLTFIMKHRRESSRVNVHPRQPTLNEL